MERYLTYCQVKKNCDKPLEIVNYILLKRRHYDSHKIKYTFVKGFGASLVAQTVKRLLTMQETQVQFLGREDSPGEGNGNPLQHACLENPTDGGA